MDNRIFIMCWRRVVYSAPNFIHVRGLMPNKPAHQDDPFKKVKTGGWSKHGGARLGLIHSQVEESWYCQACRGEQPQSLPGFLLELFPSEFVRVCASCFHKARKVEYSFQTVITQVRVENRSTR